MSICKTATKRKLPEPETCVSISDGREITENQSYSSKNAVLKRQTTGKGNRQKNSRVSSPHYLCPEVLRARDKQNQYQSLMSLCVPLVHKFLAAANPSKTSCSVQKSASNVQTEISMRVTGESVQFAQFLQLYGALCNSAKSGVVATKKPLSGVKTFFKDQEGQVVVINHVSGKGVTGNVVLFEKTYDCAAVGILKETTVSTMTPGAIEDFIAEEGAPCDKVCISNEWKFQYKQSVLYRLTQVSEGVSKMEACQKIPSYFVEVVMMPAVAHLSKKSAAEHLGCSDGQEPDQHQADPEKKLVEQEQMALDSAAQQVTESFLLKCFDLVH